MKKWKWLKDIIALGKVFSFQKIWQKKNGTEIGKKSKNFYKMEKLFFEGGSFLNHVFVVIHKIKKTQNLTG